MGSLKKYQPIWSNRLAGYREHTNVLFYYIDMIESLVLDLKPMQFVRDRSLGLAHKIIMIKS